MSDIEGLLERAENALAEIDKLAALLCERDLEKYMTVNTHYHLIRDLANHIKSDGWRPISEAPKTGKIIFMPISVKWTPYKPASEQFKKGRKGRWQQHNGWGWENMDEEPICWLSAPQSDNKEAIHDSNNL